MGCGQSKINLYPRRNKAGAKQGSKKSASSESKDGEEEDSSGATGNNAAGEAALASPEGAQESKGSPVLHNEIPKPPAPPAHSLARAASSEISTSQIDFFKMLDEKIEQGKDYDSSSETEIQLEHSRVTALLIQWESASQSSSQYNHSSPPTPSKRKMGFQERQNSKQGLEKPRSPDVRRCLKGQQTASVSPPTRRCPHPYQQDIPDKPADPKQIFDNRAASPVVPQQQVWKSGKPAGVYPQKLQSQKSLEDDSRSYSPGHLTQREIHQSYGVTSEYLDRDSQITYNPTFQSHSPAHKPAAVPQMPQPYIAQIITYPMSQQAVAYHNAQKYIAQPGITYQQQPATPATQRYPGRAQPDSTTIQPNIYYIAPTTMIPSPQLPDSAQVLTQKQQTALHLQQYVAMKQAQQAMAFGTQRMPSGQMIGSDFGNYCANPGDPPSNIARKMYERQEEGYSMNYMTLGRPSNMPKIIPGQSLRQSVPTVQQNPPAPNQMFVQNMTRVGGFQNRPGCTASLGRNQTFNLQKSGDQVGLASSIPIQNPMTARSSVNIVGVQKTVGQIVPTGGQDLVIYQNVADSTGQDQTRESFFIDQTSGEAKPKQHLGSNIVGRQMYYSQVVSSGVSQTSSNPERTAPDNGGVWKLQSNSNSVESNGSQEYL